MMKSNKSSARKNELGRAFLHHNLLSGLELRRQQRFAGFRQRLRRARLEKGTKT